jgi:hypothetical protein
MVLGTQVDASVCDQPGLEDTKPAYGMRSLMWWSFTVTVETTASF